MTKSMKIYTTVVNMTEIKNNILLKHMKKLILAVAAISCCMLSNGQSTATDFTVDNCDGESYNLFQDLDAGNVVVIAWVMPCVSCIADPVSAYSVVKEYNPDKVKYLMVDDYADHECSVIQTWSENYQMGDVTKFSNSAISMSDYGVDGMPKIVVLGCNSHKIFYNENSSSEGIKEAIDQAIEECSNTSIIDNVTNQAEDLKLSIFPNPTQERLTINSQYQDAFTIKIFNSLGKLVFKEENFHSTISVDVSAFTEGLYFLEYLNHSKSFIVNK